MEQEQVQCEACELVLGEVWCEDCGCCALCCQCDEDRHWDSESEQVAA